jgi:hypothetical protein
LPLRTALALLKHASAWEHGTLSERAFNDTVDAMWAVLRRGTPDASRDEVIEAFTLREMGQVIDFLYTRMQARHQASPPQTNGAAPASQTTAQEATPPPKPSRRRSAQENS